MKSISALILAVATALLSTATLAAPEISGTVSIKNNKATNVITGGGSLDVGGIKGLAGASMNGVANVNSLVMHDANAKVSGTVSIEGNDARDIKAIGGTANVNSVVMGQPRQ
jgi:hypothetical protein